MKKRIVLLYTILASCCLQVLGEEHDSDKQDIIDGPPVTRSEVILTADKFVRVRWEMKEVNQTGTTCDGNFKSDYPAGPRIGMGYMWNGWDDTDDFLKKLLQDMVPEREEMGHTMIILKVVSQELPVQDLFPGHGI